MNRVCCCESVSTKYVPLYRHIPEKGPNMQKPSKTLAITGMRAKHTARDYRGYVVFFHVFSLTSCSHRVLPPTFVASNWMVAKAANHALKNFRELGHIIGQAAALHAVAKVRT